MLSRNGLAAAAVYRRVKAAAAAAVAPSPLPWGGHPQVAQQRVSRTTLSLRRTASSACNDPLGHHRLLEASYVRQAAGWMRRCYSSGEELPDHIRVNIPALSPTMEMGTIISWEKREGDKVSEGDLLCEIETDKATMGFETPEEGYLAKIILPAGSKDMPVGRLLCIITPNAEDVAKFANFVPDEDDLMAGAKNGSPPSSSVPAPETPVAPKMSPIKIASAEHPVAAAVPPAAAMRPVGQGPLQHPTVGRTAASSTRAFASPAAKRVAAERGVDINMIQSGSGMDGMITAKDVENFVVPLAQPGAAAGTRSLAGMPAAMSADGPFTDAELTNMRKVIARRLQASKLEVPHYYLTVDVEMDAVLKVRSGLNGRFEKDGVKLSVNDFIIKAAALACRKVPAVNSAWMDTFIREFHTCDVSVAVDTGKGLITPIVRSADSKGLAEISTSIKEMAGRAKEGKLQPHEFQGGTMTVSNLGMFGISHFTAIINSPQSCILAVGGTKPRLMPPENKGQENQQPYRVAQVMTVTLSCDHRVVDGAVGAQWLQKFKKFLEDPQAMLL